MCERDSFFLLSARKTTIKAATGECKCLANCNKQQKKSRKSHHNAKAPLPNVNMQQQQKSAQHIHHSTMATSFMDSSKTSASTDSNLSGVSPSSTPSIGVNLRVTGQCNQGGRKYMEDYFSVAYQQSENTKDLEYAFIGIFDGHGGSEAATFAKEHLMMEIINQKHFWSDSDQDILRAIREGYIATHYAMWREQEKWPKTANGLLSTAGTTATIAFIRREKIYIGHVGDSGIVLGYQNENESFWRAKQLTTDHKPESSVERMRILRSGGKVIVKSGVPRVVWNRPRNAGHKGPIRRSTPVDEVPFLAVARSLGDLWSYNSAINEFVVSPDPDVSVIKINPNTFRCLIFGTDGLWNVVTPQEAVQTVFEKESLNERLQAQYAEGGSTPIETVQWTNPSKGLVEKALKTWSAKKMRADNTSVVSVILYPPGREGCDRDVVEACDNQTHAVEGILPQKGISSQSCGFGYTQLNAEVITYQEMVGKHLPPEDYRNFNYFEDDAEVAVQSLYAQANVEWNNVCNNLNHRDDCKTFGAEGCGGKCESDKEDKSNEGELVEEDCIENETIIANYSSFMSDSSTSSLSTPENSGGYLSFAESYNTLLNEQVSQEANASNSNGSSRSMHEIMQEQQMYQQQCMSQDEGYSLTNLETRREQCFSGVQTFKIFQSAEVVTTSAGSNEQKGPPTITEAKLFYEARHPTIFVAEKKGPLFQQQPRLQQEQTLELHSLLQQEHDEEQQVAFERLHMQMDLEGSRDCKEFEEISAESSLENERKNITEEYVEEYQSLAQLDEMVQINEVSSSNVIDCPAEFETETATIEVNDVMALSIKRGDALQNESNSLDRIKEDFVELNLEVESLKDQSSSITVAGEHLKTMRRKRAQSVAQSFPNIPNENQRRLPGKNAQQPQKRRRYDHEILGPSKVIAKSKKATRATTTEKRQLRSSGSFGSGIYDYTKRTLRTRNSLAKDMKAKPALTAASLKRSAAAAQFLRTTAVSLMSASVGSTKTTVTQTIAVRRRSSGNNVTSNNNSRKQKTTSAIVALSHGINLRSRNVGGTAAHFSKPNASGGSTASGTGGSGGLRHREQHNLRSASSKRRSVSQELVANSACLGSNTCFSKFTRSYAAPPPSPKLMNMAAASAAATRARSLLTTRNAANVSLFGVRSPMLSSTSSSGSSTRVRIPSNGSTTKRRRDAA